MITWVTLEQDSATKQNQNKLICKLSLMIKVSTVANWVNTNFWIALNIIFNYIKYSAHQHKFSPSNSICTTWHKMLQNQKKKKNVKLFSKTIYLTLAKWATGYIPDNSDGDLINLKYMDGWKSPCDWTLYGQATPILCPTEFSVDTYILFTYS